MGVACMGFQRKLLLTTRFIIYLWVFSLLTACFGTNDIVGTSSAENESPANTSTGNSDLVEQPADVTIENGLSISGRTGDGPLAGATITVKDFQNNIITIATSNEAATYTITIPSGSTHPLVITSTKGIDLVTGGNPEYTMISVAIDATEHSANINAFTTISYLIATKLDGGLSRNNLNRAVQIVYDTFNFGIDRNMIPNPITSPINSNNIMNMVIASELLYETVRRSYSQYKSIYPETSFDTFIDKLSSDLADGKLDGIGISDGNPKLALLVHVNTASLVLELLSDTFTINGTVNAKKAITEAIAQTQSDNDVAFDEFIISNQFLTQVKAAVHTAYQINENPELLTILALLEKIDMGAQIDTVILAGSTHAAAEITQLNPAVLGMQNDQASSIAQLPYQAPSNQTIISRVKTIPQSNFNLLYVDSEERLSANGAASNAFDGDPATYWHTKYSGQTDNIPHEIQIDFGDVYDISSLIYLPVQAMSNGRIRKFALYASTTGNDWGVALVEGSFVDGNNEKKVFFKTTTSRYIRIVALEEVNGNAWTSIAELNFEGILVANGNPQPENAIPKGIDDIFTTGSSSPIIFDVLANDQNLTDGPISVAIFSGVQFGTATIGADNSLVYTPPAGFSGTEHLTYIIKDIDGDTTTANVTINVTCKSCSNPNTVTLAWEKNTDPVDGYKIYVGSSKEVISDLIATTTNNTLSLNVGSQLNVNRGDTICFKIQSFNADGDSYRSDPICKIY